MKAQNILQHGCQLHNFLDQAVCLELTHSIFEPQLTLFLLRASSIFSIYRCSLGTHLLSKPQAQCGIQIEVQCQQRLHLYIFPEKEQLLSQERINVWLFVSLL